MFRKETGKAKISISGGFMTARVKPHRDITIISLGGTLDIEYTQAFKEACLKKFQNKKVIFNMENANFVGSTGIQPFMETLQTLASAAPAGLKMVGVGVEFKRIFQNLEIQNLEICDSEALAIGSFLGGSVQLV
jgi:anti-anti-sigma factor